jgi:hypothetical protein
LLEVGDDMTVEIGCIAGFTIEAMYDYSNEHYLCLVLLSGTPALNRPVELWPQ